MYTLKVLTISSLKIFLRNRQAIFFTLFMPVVIMGVFGLLGLDRIPKAEVGLVLTSPPTEGTKQIVSRLKEVPVFTIHENIEPKERKALEDGDRAVVFVVPGDLIPERPQGSVTGRIKALVNEGEQQQASTAISILNQMLDKTTLSIVQAPQMFAIDSEIVNSRNLKYFDFLLPGVVALAIMQMSVFSVAFVFADYKEKGILKRLLATPMKPYQFVTANVITRLLVAVVQAVILIAVGVLLFNAHLIGSFWAVMLFVFIGAIVFLGLGFTISGFAHTVEAVPAIANLVVFPMLFLGGTFFPVSTMPEWLQKIVNFMPLTHLTNPLREIMTRGTPLSELTTDLYWLLGWALLLILAANFTFKFEGNRQ